MSKPFKTIDEQIEILKLRGLIIEDEERAKKHLLMYNYYNVINCYSKYLSNNNFYLKGANFNEIIQIHMFDEEIKSTLFKYLIEIEKHLKSIISYIFSKNHSAQNYPYLYTSNFRDDDLLSNTNLISKLAKIIREKSNAKLPPNSIKHYKNQHQNIPLWVLSNYMSLGETILFFQRMKDSDQNEVAKEFSVFLNENLSLGKNVKLSSSDFLSILKNIKELRNVIAHNNKLLGFECRENIRYIKELHSKYSINSNDKKQDIYNIFIAMQAVLSKNQYGRMHNTLLSRIKTLNKKLTTISSNEVLKSLGFPKDWHLSAKLPQ